LSPSRPKKQKSHYFIKKAITEKPLLSVKNGKLFSLLMLKVREKQL
jgi:hypothetical protein